MNYKDFSSKIKSKYPDYSDMDDLELAQKMVAKYPEYSDVQFDNEPAPKDPVQSSGIGGYWTEDLPNAAKGIATRTMQRAGRVEQPTELGSAALRATGAKGTLGEFVEGTAGAPERIGRLVGGAAGTIGDVAGTAIGLAGKGVDRLAGGKLSAAAKPALEGVAKGVGGLKPIQAAANWYDKQSPAAKANYGSAVDMTELIGMGTAPGAAKVARKVTGEAIEGAGNIVEKAGKGVMKGQLKIEKPLARALGPNIDEAKNRIVNAISKHKLQSTTGNFEKLASKADDLYGQLAGKADEAIETFVKKNPGQKIDSPDLFGQIENEIISGGAIPLGKEDQALKELNKIFDAAIKYGYTGEAGKVDLQELVTLKRALNPDGKLFKKGPQNIELDPINSQLRENLYLKIVETIENQVPEAARLNREARDVRFVRDAAEAASARIKNRNKVFDATSLVLGTGGTAGAMASGNLGPLVATGAAILANKVAGQGRGASALISTGKGIGALGKAIQPAPAGRTAVRSAQGFADNVIPMRTGGSMNPKEALEQALQPAALSKQQKPSLKSMLTNERGTIGGGSVNPQVKSENFKKWSNNAPVVKMGQADYYRFETGKPVVVEGLHGSDKVFTKFDDVELGQNTGAKSAKQGHFFTDQPDVAEFYPAYSEDAIYQDLKRTILPETKRVKSEIAQGGETVRRVDFGDDRGKQILVDVKFTNGGKASHEINVNNLNDLSDDEAIKIAKDKITKVGYGRNVEIAPAKYDIGKIASRQRAIETELEDILFDSTDRVSKYLENNKDFFLSGDPEVTKFFETTNMPYKTRRQLVNLRAEYAKNQNDLEMLRKMFDKHQHSKRKLAGSSEDEVWEGVDYELKPNVSKNYIKFNNPLVYDYKGKGYRDVSYAEVIATAKAQGRDGVILRNTSDPYKTNIFVALDANNSQIKSATGNSGAFSPTNPDIRGNSGLKMLGSMSGMGAAGLTGFAAFKAAQKKKDGRR
jgi:hypothetical protein